MLEHAKIDVPYGLLDAPTAMVHSLKDDWLSRFGSPHFDEGDMDAGVPAPAVAWCVKIGGLEVFVEQYLHMGTATLYIGGGSVEEFLGLVGLADVAYRRSEVPS